MNLNAQIVSPLEWPSRWPRYQAERLGDSRFRRQNEGRLSLPAATLSLNDELSALSVNHAVVCMNIKRGTVLSRQKVDVDDPGVAVYFQREGRDFVIAQDKFRSISGNVRSLALAVQAIRQIERHGGGVIADRVFEGFTALPAPPANQRSEWWDILNVHSNASIDQVRRAWRTKSAEAQRCGDMELAQRLNAAWAQAKAATAP